MKKILPFIFLFFSIAAQGQATAENSPIRILLGSPVRKSPAILREFIQSLHELKKSSFTMDYYFVDDNVNPDSSQLLQNFANEIDGVCHIIQPGVFEESPEFKRDVNKRWNESLVWKVAHFKDKMLQFALDEGYDYIFFIDSDLVLHPETVEHLLTREKEIVCSVFWTIWTPGTRPNPQVWHYDQNTQWQIERGKGLTQPQRLERFRSFLNMLKHPGTYEIGGIGACTLITRSAIEKGISFREVDNVSFWGEDRHFCIRAIVLGIPLFVDTHYPAYHIYRESNLDGVEAFKQACRENPKSLEATLPLSKTGDEIFAIPFDDEFENPSSIFYLARRYHSAHNLELAIQVYAKRVQMGGWDQEIFYSKYQIARLQQTLEKNPPVFVSNYWIAYSLRPSRVEPLYHLANYYRIRGHYQEAYSTSKLGLSQTLPSGELLIEKWIYDWGLLFELSIAAYWLEKYEEAEKACLTLLENGNLPNHIRQQVKINLAFIMKKINSSHGEPQ